MAESRTTADSDCSIRSDHSELRRRPSRPLTARQSEVLAGIALRKPIKQIANEAGISESAVNQHIRVLKQACGVNSLTELAQCYREMDSADGEDTCRKSTCNDNQLFFGKETPSGSAQDNLQPVVEFNEPLAYQSPPPWARLGDANSGLQVVPEVLNGRDANWVRTAAMVAVAFGTLLILLVGLGVVQGLSSAFQAHHLPPQETSGPGE